MPLQFQIVGSLGESRPLEVMAWQRVHGGDDSSGGFYGALCASKLWTLSKELGPTAQS